MGEREEKEWLVPLCGINDNMRTFHGLALGSQSEQDHPHLICFGQKGWRIQQSRKRDSAGHPQLSASYRT